jgi:hypothetical protein
MISPQNRRKPKDVFVCDACGKRERLEANKRHWCDNCTRGKPIEMRRAKDKWRTVTK